MDAKLKKRAQAIANLSREGRRKPEALPEIKEVHYLLYAHDVPCTWCNVDELVRRISQKLTQEPLIIKDMANAKIVFKHNAASREVIRHTKNGTVKITPENLNEGDNAKFMAESYSHLIEESKAGKTEAATEAKNTAPVSSKKKKKAARAAATQTPAPEVTPAKTTVEPTTEAE